MAEFLNNIIVFLAGIEGPMRILITAGVGLTVVVSLGLLAGGAVVYAYQERKKKAKNVDIGRELGGDVLLGIMALSAAGLLIGLSFTLALWIAWGTRAATEFVP